MEPLVVIVVIVAMVAGLVLFVRSSAASKERAAAEAAARQAAEATRIQLLESRAQPSLDALRVWRESVESQLKAAADTGRWLPRDVRNDWIRTRPHPSSAAVELARITGRGDEARSLLALHSVDLESMASTANQRIRNSELTARADFFNRIEKQPLTEEQAAAVVTFDNRVQVIAAAGSGKTSVMVARAAYAIDRGIVPAQKILMLAFNRDAAVELQGRVSTRLTAASIDFDGLVASTFHAFGLAVIGQAAGKKPRLAPWLDQGGDVGMVSRIADELRDGSPEFRIRWDLYRLLFAGMADHPNGGHPDSYDYEAKTTGFRTFNGEVVRSQGERLIADFLFLNGVPYQYEAPYAFDVADSRHSQYRPDFYYPTVDVWHEHWALDRQGHPPSEFAGYAESMAWRKDVHRKYGTALIETTWASIIDGRGFEPLAHDLEERGLTLDWNPDRPIPGAAPVKHEDLARLMRSFMTHVKSNCLTRGDLDARLNSQPDALRYRTRLFLDLYWEVHDAWEARLRAAQVIDFEDMLVQAAGHLEAGDVDMGYDLVLVDEFQDASQARARMVRALVNRPHRYLMAVGDDWQSINRFAGADLGVMTSFVEWFGDSQVMRLQTTFRSPQAICDTASSFVSKNPRQLNKHVVSVHEGYGEPVQLVRVRGVDEVPSAVAGILDALAGGVKSGEILPGPSGTVTVDVLGRYRFDRDLLPNRVPPGLKPAFRTVHASKGLEADYIILPNVSSGTYGFPSEIVDDPVLRLAMSEPDPFPSAEERRLFYVALTRARRGVILIGVEGQESSFVAELVSEGRIQLSPLSTAEASTPCPACSEGFLVVRRQRATGREFLGCSAFPKCSYSESLAF